MCMKCACCIFKEKHQGRLQNWWKLYICVACTAVIIDTQHTCVRCFKFFIYYSKCDGNKQKCCRYTGEQCTILKIILFFRNNVNNCFFNYTGISWEKEHERAHTIPLQAEINKFRISVFVSSDPLFPSYERQNYA